MLDFIRNEPAIVTGIVAAAISLAVSLGLDLTPEQVGYVMAIVSGVLSVILRQRVTPA